MFAHDGRATASDLSYWLGPLSSAFATVAAAGADSNRDPKAASHGPVEPTQASGEAPLPAALPDPAELRTLFHSLNNQLGVILTYAELLEAKAPDEGMRARATQIVTATIAALATSKDIRSAVVK